MALTDFLSNSLSSRRRFLIGNLAIIAALVAMAAFSAWQSRIHHRQLTEISLDNLNRALGKHIGTVVEKTDLSLRTVAIEAGRQLARGGGMDHSLLHRTLEDQKNLQPDLYGLRLLDSAGNFLYGTNVPPGARANFSDRDYFIRLRDDPQAGLVIGGPYQSRISGQWVMILARRLSSPDGSFAGAVSAVITAEHFGKILSSPDLGAGGIVALHAGDLRLIARVPEFKGQDAIGSMLTTPAFEESLRSDPDLGSFTAVSPLDRMERNFVYRKVPDLPLYVVVGRAAADTWSAWYIEAAQLTAIVAAFGALTLWLLLKAQRAEAEQRAARQLLEEAVESIDAGFTIFDREDRLLICNKAYRDLHPSSRHLLVPGGRFEDFLRHDAASGQYPEASANPEEWVRERLQRHRDGDGMPFEEVAGQGRHLLTIERRTPSGYGVGSQLDITELAQYRDRLERLVEERTAKLQAALGQFRILVEQAPTAIAMLDRNMNYLAASDRWSRAVGLPLNDLIGRNLHAVQSDIPDHWKEAYRAALAGTPQERDEDCLVRSDGTLVWLTWAVYPWRDEHGDVGGIIIARDDITRRKQAEEEIQRFNVELEKRVAERTAELVAANRELEGFTFATSHDLRGPLGRINSFSTLLERNYRDRLEGEGLVFLDFIRQNATRLIALVDDLLSHARVAQKALEHQTVDLQALVQAIVQDRAEDLREAGAKVWLDLGAAQVVGDEQALSQAVGNLVENALKYSAKKAKPVIEIGGKRVGRRYRLWVRDNGIGFDMTYHDKIFEMFRRLHTYGEYQGSGVGLALVKRATERMGGRVWAESVPGQGATFFLELPVEEAAEAVENSG